MRIDKKLYLALNFTWGIIMTTIGGLVVGILLAIGFNAHKHKNSIYVLVPGLWGGISLGYFFIVCDETDPLLNHEYGHTIQNAIYGPGMIVVGLWSLLRAAHRQVQSSKGKTLEPYESIWFEAQATEWGHLNH